MSTRTGKSWVEYPVPGPITFRLFGSPAYEEDDGRLRIRAFSYDEEDTRKLVLYPRGGRAGVDRSKVKPVQ